MDTSRTGVTGQTMDATTVCSCWVFFFFFFPPLACFWQGSLVGVSWIYKEGSLTKDNNIKKKLEQVT